MKQPKYKVGDILIYGCEDGTQATFVVDRIEEDKYGRYIYYHEYSPTCGTFIYEEDVVGVLDPDADKYKRYQLYLELKKEFG